MYRRRAASKVDNAGNSYVEPAPNVYEMSSGGANQPVYTTVQSGASAPAGNTVAGDEYVNITQFSATPARPRRYQDITLIDNDLYR